MERSAFPLKRNVAGLQDDAGFDVLVIGGGIYGAWTAYDAASRGLRTALIDAEDWGAGTSSASSKLIHGGLRYLENFEFGLVRHALTERRVLARLAPHMVRPLNFVLPVWRGARVGMGRLHAGLMLYDTLAWGRQPVQRHKRFNRERLLARYPFLAADGLRGGFRYGDCQEDDARLVMLVVAAAQAAGAVCANHVRAEQLLHDESGAVIGAAIHDRLGDTHGVVRARHTVATVGPWVREMLGDASPAVQFVKGTHLVLPGIPDCHSAFLLNAPQDGRVFFIIPYYHRTLVGTTEMTVNAPADAQPTDAECRYLLAAAHAWMPGLPWREEDIIQRFAGIRTLQAQDAGSLSKVSREFEITQPCSGLTLPVGGKYTTARHDASEIIDGVARTLGNHHPCVTDRAPLPGAPPAGVDFGVWLDDACQQLQASGLDPAAAHQAALRHGSRIERLCADLRASPELAVRIRPDSPFARVEASIAICDEMAMTADDVLRRRLPLDLLDSDPVAARAAIAPLLP